MLLFWPIWFLNITSLKEIIDAQVGYKDSNFHLTFICRKNNPIYFYSDFHLLSSKHINQISNIQMRQIKVIVPHLVMENTWQRNLKWLDNVSPPISGRNRTESRSMTSLVCFILHVTVLFQHYRNYAVFITWCSIGIFPVLFKVPCLSYVNFSWLGFHWTVFCHISSSFYWLLSLSVIFSNS